MKNFKALSRANATFPCESRIGPSASPPQPSPPVSLTQCLLLAGVLLLGISLAIPIHAQAFVVLSPASLTIQEGESKTFQVRLSSSPGSTRTFNLSSTNPDVTVSPTTLTFSSWWIYGNWHINQTVTVSVADDADGENENAAINITGGGLFDSSLGVTVLDDDTPIGLALSASVLDMNEGSSAPFAVRLAGKPVGNRTVKLSSDDPEVSLSPTTLTFTPDNWNSDQTVTIMLARDADKVNDLWKFTLSGEHILGSEVNINVLDIDKEEVTLTAPKSVTLDEGESKTFNVRLRFRPSGNRTVNLMSNSTLITFSKSSLSFTPDNWNSDQAVTISAGHDGDKTDNMVTLDLTGNQVVDAWVKALVIDDDDTAVDLVRSPTSLTIREGNSETFRVRLSRRPSNSRTVKLKSESGKITLSPKTLEFLPQHWKNDQTVTVSALHDADKFAHEGTITLTGNRITLKSMNVSVVDDEDTDVRLNLSATSLRLDEGESEPLNVRLLTQPGRDRIVTLTSTIDSIRFNPAELTFTSANWSTNRSVSVTATEDNDSLDETGTVRLGGDGVISASVGTSVTDNDIGLIVSPTSLTVDEGGSAIFTVRPAGRPSADVTVTVAKSGTSSGDVTFRINGDEDGSQTSLEFTPTNWDTARRVTVTAAQDADSADDTETIKLAGDGIAPQSVSVTVDDDEDVDVGLTLAKTSVEVNERGSGSFTVRLASKTGNNRTVSLSSDNSDVTVSPASLTFTSTNGTTPQTVTVSAARDGDRMDESATITLGGEGITASATVGVTVIDTDVGLTLSPSSLTMSEGGTESFTVSLNARPIKERILTLASASSYVTVDTDSAASGNQTSLTFTKANWSTPRTVSVTAASDNDNADQTDTINLRGASVVDGSLSVSVLESVGLTLSESSLKMNEGSSGIFKVRLAAQPGSGRTVNLSTGNSKVTVTPASLTFTRANWSTPRTVTVTAAHDADNIDIKTPVELTGRGVAAGSLWARVVDDEDVAKIEVATKGSVPLENVGWTLGEGGSGLFYVWLTGNSVNARTVTLTSDNPDITLNPQTLTLPSSWYAGSVRIRALQDDNEFNDTATISVTGSRVTTHTRKVWVTDNDYIPLNLALSATSLTVDEGGTAEFTVKLAERPGRDRTVTLKSSSKKVTFDTAPDEEGIQTQLTFTAGEEGNWDEPQNVRVTAAQDDDGDHERATLTLSGTRVVTSSVAVAVTDDDVALSLSATSLTIDEGRSKTFTVRLTKDPSVDVTVTLVRSGDADIKIGITPTSLGSTATLDFSSSNWQTPQTVTVKGQADDGYIDDKATINLTAAGASILPVSAKVSVTDDEDADVGLKLWKATDQIAEGGSLMLRVSLDAQPKNDRVIDLTLSGDNTSAVTLSTARLIFTPSNWSIAQAVTITAAKDHNRDDETVMFNLSGIRIADSPRTGSVTVLDNNAYNKLILDKTWLGLDEGADLQKVETRGTFTVRMSSSWSIDRTVTLEPSGLSVTLDPSSLTFTLKNWYIPQTVKVGARSDDKKGNSLSQITIKDGDRKEGQEGAFSTTSLRVQVQDPKYIGAGLSKTTLSVNEGSSKTFNVWVTDEPYANRTVRLDVSGGGQNAQVTLDKTVLTFTPFNWNTPQIVTVSADQDADANGGAVTIRPQFRVINSSGDYEWVNADSPSLTVSIIDDDSGGTGLNVSGVLRNLNGDDAGSLAVSLAARPGNKPTHSLQILSRSASLPDVDSSASGSQSPPALNADGWSVPQTAAVRARPGNDRAGDAHRASFTDVSPIAALLSKSATGAGIDSARNFSAIPPPAGESGEDIIAVRRFSPSPGEAGMSP